MIPPIVFTYLGIGCALAVFLDLRVDDLHRIDDDDDDDDPLDPLARKIAFGIIVAAVVLLWPVWITLAAILWWRE